MKSTIANSARRRARRVAPLCAAALGLLPLAARASPTVWTESSSVKVQPGATPNGSTSAKISAAMNEYESFQVVITADGSDATGVTASASDLTGPGSGIPASALRLYREAYLEVTSPSGTIGQVGTWPDGLVPAVDEIDGQQRNAFPFTVPAGQSRAIWVDVLVPSGATPGIYSGSIAVQGDGLSASVPVQLEVWNFQLPSTPSLSSAFLAFSGNVCLAHTGASDCGSAQAAAQLLSKYERLALDNRISIPNIFVQHNQGDDWSAFDAVYGPLLDGGAPTQLPGAKMTSAQYTWDRGLDTYGPFAKHFSDQGWLGRLFDYAADEPPYGSAWTDIPTHAQQAKAADPGVQVLVTTEIDQAQANGALPYLDILVPIVNDMESTVAPYQGDQRPSYDSFLSPGKSLWMYQSCMSHGCSFGGGEPGTSWPSYMVDVPAVRNRLMQWADFKAGVSGELYYETVNAYSGDPWSSLYQFSGNGDGTLFYPGTPAKIGGQSDVPLPSIRLKMIRDGVEDFEYLTMVSQLGDPDLAKQVAASVLPDLYAAGQSDPSKIEAARQQLAQRILDLRSSTSSSIGAPMPLSGPPAPGGQAGSTSPDAAGASGCGLTTAPGAPVSLAALLLAPLALFGWRRRR